jgi:hypothetical protein
MEVRRPVVAGDDRLAVDQERRCLDAERGVNDGRETIGPVMAALGEAADARAPSYTFSSQAKAIHIMVRC